MISDTRRIFGNVSVLESRGYIKISGVNVRLLTQDIYRYWGTSRITKHMFTRLGRSELIFHPFYALELYYALGELVQEPTTNSSTRFLLLLKELLLENTWLGHTTQPTKSFLNRSAIRELKLSLMDHQERFLDTFEEQTQRYNLNGYLLAGAPGSGKTITALALALALKADKVIVVSPKNAIYKVWEKTLKENYRRPPSFYNSGDRKPVNPDADYHIFHYEALDQALVLADKVRARRPMVILDESHNFNELSAKRTQRFVSLCERLDSPTVLWASGTPIKALGGEMVPFLRTIDPLFTEDVEEGFVKLFGRSQGHASDILANRLGEVTFKVEKTEYSERNIKEIEHLVSIPNGNDYTLSSVKKDMRNFIKERAEHYKAHRQKYHNDFYSALTYFEENEVKTSTEEKEWVTYKSYLNEIIKHYDPYQMKEQSRFCNHYELNTIAPTLPDKKTRDAFKNARSVVKYVNLKIQGEALGRILGRKRTECHLDMVVHVGMANIVDQSVKKTVIFTSYVEVADAAKRHFVELGYKPLVVHGSTGDDLNRVVSEFDQSIDANPLIATFKSLSTAVPLIMANTVINLNAPFRDYEYQQAISRVDRIGQDTPVEIYNVILDTGEEVNISSRSKDILSWSKEQVAALMGVPVVDDHPEVSLEAIESDYELPAPKPVIDVPIAANW